MVVTKKSTNSYLRNRCHQQDKKQKATANRQTMATQMATQSAPLNARSCYSGIL